MPEPDNDNPKIVRFYGVTRLDFSPEEVLRHAAQQNFEDIIIIGRRSNGQLSLDYTTSSAAEVNLMLDQIKQDLLSHV